MARGCVRRQEHGWVRQVYNEHRFWIQTIKTKQGNQRVLGICSSECVRLHASGGVLGKRRAWTPVQSASVRGTACRGQHSPESSGMALQESPPDLHFTQHRCLHMALLLLFRSDLPISVLKWVYLSMTGCKQVHTDGAGCNKPYKVL